MNSKNPYVNLKTVLSLASSVFVFSYFLLLGRDNSEQAKFVRFYAQAVLLLLTVFLAAKNKTLVKPFSSVAFCFFGIFTLFQLTRYGIALSPKAGAVLQGDSTDQVLLGLSVFPLQWVISFGIFWIFYQVGSFRTLVISSGKTFVWAAFFVAVSGLPTLLLTGKNYYLWGNGNSTYFPPFLYVGEWVEKYILIRVGHVNVTGDIIALGVFPALGFSIYALHLWRTSRHSEEIPMPGDKAFLRGPAFISLYVMAALTSIACLLLHLSRGTMASFMVSIFFFLGAIGLRFIRKKHMAYLAVGLIVGGSFLAWSSSFPKVISELISLQVENGQEGSSSMANAKGKQIARAIHHKFPVWGVGNETYQRLAERYDPEYSVSSKPLYHSTAFSHYFQVLAEQGLGAFIYFLFLMAWFIELVIGLIRTSSYFKFVMALSFACGVLQVLVHASFGFLMEYFSTAALTYMGMGISLAIVKKSFKHE